MGTRLLFYYNPEHKDANKGVNFSSEFRFQVECKGDEYTLSMDENWKGGPDIFASNPDLTARNIKGVTAIVGENGSGKTTLMKGLLETFVRVNRPYEHYQKPFVVVFETEDKNGRTWKALAHDNHDMYRYAFKRHSSIPAENFEWIAVDEDDCIQWLLPDISLAYLTNSGYGPNLDYCGEAALMTPGRLADTARKFYDSRLKYPLPAENLGSANESHYYWLRRYMEYETDSIFQGICDLQYYYKSAADGMSKRSVRFRARFADVYSILLFPVKLRDGGLQGKSIPVDMSGENPFHMELSHEVIEQRAAYAAQRARDMIQTDGLPILAVLYTNLAFEWSLANATDLPESVKDWRGAKTFLTDMYDPEEKMTLRDFRNKYDRWFMGYGKAISDNEKNELYYQSALAAIRFLEASFSFPADDDRLSFHEKNMKKFLRFVEDCWHVCPFIMKYLIVEQPGMSSGERALQNLLSWLNLLSDYGDLMGDSGASLHKDLILLIDEMDLYLHPDWQRRFLNNLLKNLGRPFGGFNIQLIFATHSPLCLSDVPRENTVYLLSRRRSDSAADGPPPYRTSDGDHEQTFGAPVFTLLDDAFFLKGKGVMGVFAENYINRILEDIELLRQDVKEMRKKRGGLSSQAFEERMRKIEGDAQCIGNPPLQRHIAQMLKWLREDWELIGEGRNPD